MSEELEHVDTRVDLHSHCYDANVLLYIVDRVSLFEGETCTLSQ